MKKSALHLAGLSIVGFLLWHCGPKVGVIGPAGFENAVYEYRVSYRDPAQKMFLGPDWQLDNYYFNTATNSYKAKTGPDYVAEREFDLDGDGTISLSEKSSEPIYDLRFVNTKDDGVIWIKAHPVAIVDRQRDLEVVLNNYADGLSGTGLYAQGNLFSVEHAKSRAFTTFVTMKEPITLGGLPGLAGEIEIAEVEKLRLDPKYRSEKVKVAFVRFVFHESMYHTETWPVVQYKGAQVYERPALLIAGYFNRIANFDSHVKEFDETLKQLSLGPSSAIPGRPSTPVPSSSAPIPPASASAQSAVPVSSK
jgi:hypothetical protein